MSDLQIGQTLDGRYRLDAVIGKGAMGKVYRATHIKLDEPVAVKFLLGRWAHLAEYRARFKREAKVLARIRHPSIVSVIDFGEDNGNAYLVMELLSGRTLRELLDKGQLLSFPMILTIVEQVAGALVAAHAASVVHRDLKPENVMLLDGPDAPVKVLDFGLAYADDQPGGARLSEENSVRGTPLYMSPEQCRGKPVTPASDVYSVGVLLYELLAGVVPFGAEGSSDVMAQHLFVEPPLMIERAQRPVPAALEEVALLALSKRAEQRPSAQQLREQLLDIGRSL